MSYSVILLLLQITFATSFPKLGHVLFDPLAFESAKNVDKDKTSDEINEENQSDDDFLENDPSNESIMKNLYGDLKSKSEYGTTKPTARRQYSQFNIIEEGAHKKTNSSNTTNTYGYDFDETQCKYVNNRLLCGYNKNLGEIPKDDSVVNLPNGCQMRGERYECGYVRKTPKSLREIDLTFAPRIKTFISLLKKLTIQEAMPPSTNISDESSSIFPEVSSNNSPIHALGSTQTLTISENIIPSSNYTNTVVETVNTETNNYTSTENYDTTSNSISHYTSITSEPTTGKTTKELLTSRTELSEQVQKSIRQPEIKPEHQNINLRNKEIISIPKPCSPCEMKRESSRLQETVPLEDTLSDTHITKSTNDGVSSTRCVEIADRIVCYPYKNKIKQTTAKL